MEPASPFRRFSSRRQKLAQSFLAERLYGAKAYDRIAGYFCASILETAGEALQSVAGSIRVVCNSDLRPQDVATARTAAAALRQEWCGFKPEVLIDTGGDAAKVRLSRLYQFLTSGKLQIRVLPDEYFGLIAVSNHERLWRGRAALESSPVRFAPLADDFIQTELLAIKKYDAQSGGE